MAQLAKEIEKILIPEVGEFVAKATIKRQCSLIGITPETLSFKEFDVFLEKLENSINFLAGKEVAKRVVEKARELKFLTH